MILLTGATGYLGQHVMANIVARKLEGRATSGVFCDLTKPSAVQVLLERTHPTVIIHCAAKVPKHMADYGNPIAASASVAMMKNLSALSDCPIVFASSCVASNTIESEYALGKWRAEHYLSTGSVALRLPGLFGLPRRSGVIYTAAKMGMIPESFGPYPAMHVQDAAEYLVRAATMPSDGNREPISVTYGNPRLEACYGLVGATFQQRVQEFVEQLRMEGVACGR